jgi:hypothetical protein
MENEGEGVVGGEGGKEGGEKESGAVGGGYHRGATLLRPRERPETLATQQARTQTYTDTDAADLDGMSREEQLYMECRLRGEIPTESMRQVDRQMKRVRSANAVMQAASKMEKRLKKEIRDSVRADEMTDGQYYAWERRKLESALSNDESGLAGKVTVIKYLRERREQRKYSSMEAIIQRIGECRARLEELQGIAQTGQTHSVSGAVDGGE